MIGLALWEVAELDDAKADERLVVLPCKVGDTVYTIPSYFSKQSGNAIPVTVKGWMLSSYSGLKITGHNGRRYIFGRSAFATRQEAEAAITGKGEDDE